jgi:hypothetical protein
MDLHKILSELREDRERVAAAIIVLENMNGGRKRRGRKPAWMKAEEGQPANSAAPKRGPGRPRKTEQKAHPASA